MSDAAVVHVTSVDSPVGEIVIATDGTRLLLLDFALTPAAVERRCVRRFGANVTLVDRSDPLGITDRVRRYFAGELTAFDDLAVDGGGTSYQTRVWSVLRTIAPGATWNYAELARCVGATHARAVGQANARNPIAIVVPCHRVIGANAALTGYAGGLERKRMLLAHEARHARTLPLFAATAGAR